MAEWWLGAAAWAYPHYRGALYPPGTPESEMLRRYSKTFRFVELDATHHVFHDPDVLRGWMDQVPAGFRFSPKVHRSITHDHRLQGVDDLLQRFVATVDVLRGRLGPIVLQLPPSLARTPEAEAGLEAVLGTLRRRFDVAVEARHASWFVPETEALLRRHGAALSWTVLDGVPCPRWRTAPFLYLRFVGDYALERPQLGAVRRDRRGDFAALRDGALAAAAEVPDAYVAMTNHLEGSAPLSLQRLCAAWGLPSPELAAARGGLAPDAARQARLF